MAAVAAAMCLPISRDIERAPWRRPHPRHRAARRRHHRCAGGAGRAGVVRATRSMIVGIGTFRHRARADEGGRRGTDPDILEGSIFTDNAWSTLGLGWLGACIVLSGSPMAASALALLDGGAIDRNPVVHDAHRLAPRRRVRGAGRRRRSTRPRAGHGGRAGPDLHRHPLAADDDGRRTCPARSSATCCSSGARSTGSTSAPRRRSRRPPTPRSDGPSTC